MPNTSLQQSIRARGPRPKAYTYQVGQRVGSFIILERVYKEDAGHHGVEWRVRCDCGELLDFRSDYISRAKHRGCLLKKNGHALRALYYQYHKQDQIKNREFDLTLEQFERLTSQDCFYCGAKPFREHKYKYGSAARNEREVHDVYVFNGLDRKLNSIGHIFENCAPCCWTCNKMKSSLNWDFFLSHVKSIARRHEVGF